jgi:hypothetical protein
MGNASFRARIGEFAGREHIRGEAIIILIALCKLALHLATAGRFGYFIDELYTVAMGRHLGQGFVDVPPLAPILTGGWTAIFGVSLFSIRALAGIIGAVTVYMAGRMAREMGLRPAGQGLVATAVLFSGAHAAFNSFLAYDGFDQLLSCVFFFFVVRLMRTGDKRLWIAVGTAAGAALMAKYTLLFIGLAFAIALVVSARRKDLLTPWPWLGAAAAVLIALPWGIWQGLHGWPVIEYWRNYARIRVYNATVPEFAIMQLVMYNPVSAPLWLGGLAWLLFSKAAKPFRLLGLTALAAYAVFFLTRAKGYMSAALYPPLFAAGAMAIQGWIDRRPRGRRWAPPAAAAVIAGFGALMLPATVPILDAGATLAYVRKVGFIWNNVKLGSVESALPQIFADRFGWPEDVESVAKAYGRLTEAEKPDCLIVASFYGLAGAIDVLGRDRGLPPASSGHLSYWLWGYRGKSGNVAIFAGYSPYVLRSLYESVEPAIRAKDEPMASNYNRRVAVNVCRGLKVPIERLWEELKHYD